MIAALAGALLAGALTTLAPCALYPAAGRCRRVPAGRP